MHTSTLSLVAVAGFVSLAYGVALRDEACNLPDGKNTVKVSLINPTRFVGTPPPLFLTPDINGTTMSDIPSFSALIEHQDAKGKKTKLVFDLGLREDWKNLPPPAANTIRAVGTTIYSFGDPTVQLRKGGIKPEAIDAVILSHSHFDHVGNLNLFPKKTGVIVGPGFKAAYLPGYPTNPESFLDQPGFDDRSVVEFPTGKKPIDIAALEAVDYFGDGSFYLVSTPGHDYGHLAALARTTKGKTRKDDTFILLAGDSTHHCGAIRPTRALPLPRNIPNRQHLLDIHPRHSPYEPFYHPIAGGFNLNATEMDHTLVKLERLDGNPNVLTVLAHDRWLLDVVDLFPKAANDWKRKAWGEQSRFRFVKDFA